MLKNLDNLHHAYLVVGDEDFESYLRGFFEEEGVKLLGSPDFFVYKEEVFGIDEARELSLSAARKAFISKKVFLIAPAKITPEAQNALLKTFEDPYPDTHFFLVVADPELILPTLRSRMMMWRRVEISDKESKEAAKFLNLSLKERLNFAKNFAEKEKNISVFLDELLEFVRGNTSKEALKQVYEMRKLSDVRAASSRLILEHLSLVL